jgi:hypothetical protein
MYKSTGALLATSVCVRAVVLLTSANKIPVIVTNKLLTCLMQA